MGNRKKRQEDEIMTEYFLDALAGKGMPDGMNFSRIFGRHAR